MYTKFVCVVLLSVALLENAEGKRSRKNKYVNNEPQDSTPQPSVLTYSTFGFNDVGSYDGFVPSSPDYANYLNFNREHAPRLYAPAFPSASDSSFANNAPQVGEEQSSVNNFQQAPMSFFTSPSADFKEHAMLNEGGYGPNTDDGLAYGAKISSKTKNKLFNEFNNTGLNIYGSIAAITESEASNEKNNMGMHMQTPFDTKVGPNEPNNIHQNIFRQSFQSQYNENEPNERPISTESPLLKFPKVIDFTKFKPNYPTSVENKYLDISQKPLNLDGGENSDSNINENNFGQTVLNHMYQSKYNFNKDATAEKEVPKINSFHYQDTPDNSIHIGQGYKHNKINTEYKDKVKSRPWYLNDNEKKKHNQMKGYEYSTNESSTSFKYEYGPPKTDFNSSVDEIAPASSNHGFTSYQLPEHEYPEIGKIPSIQTQFGQNSNPFSFYNKPIEEHLNEYKNPYTTIPTSSSHWGNVFKSSDFSIHKNHPWKPTTNDDHDEIVHIPKKHQNQKYTNEFDSKPNEWPSSQYFRPSKMNYKPQLDWKENFNTKYKSEEDLLGLRTHDTSKPNYLPNYKPGYNDFSEELEYKKLIEKWRQNYIRAKQKDAFREYESYASDSKPVHVPMPRPYPIEVPHPVIVPVPEPYPVKVPIPKPVAVPVIRELTVPIEKPVPYPVIKKVPYPIIKAVPVPVEKQVHVPVEKPFPVPIPQIKPVFHHTKQRDEEPDVDDEYSPPQRDKRPFNKKAKNYRSRPRPPPPSKRPSRMTYQDRNKRRPTRPTSSSSDHRYYRRPTSNREHYRPHRYHDDFDEYDNEPSDYALYCKRTGNC